MKKYKGVVYFFLIIVIIGFSCVVYAKVSKDDEKTEKDRKIAELDYVESEISGILNELNNININNYNLSVNSVIKQAKNQDNKSKNGQEESNGEDTSSSDNSKESSDSEQQSEFNMKNDGVLTNNDEINWKRIKSKIENLYSSIPIITVDLYQSGIKQDDVLNFNKEFDNLTVEIKQNNKENSLGQLSRLYNYISDFAQNIYNDEFKKIEIKTKNYIFKAYSKLDSEKWQDISDDIKQASNVYSKLLTDVNINQSSYQYTISKNYVMINELQNAIQLKDKEVFLIKFKNIIEEL